MSNLKCFQFHLSTISTEVENFIKENRHLGYTTKEEFTRDSVRRRLNVLNEKYETIEIPKEEYDELNEAIDEMNLPYMHATDFIYNQINAVLKEYEGFKKKEREKMQKEEES